MYKVESIECFKEFKMMVEKEYANLKTMNEQFLCELSEEEEEYHLLGKYDEI